MIYQIAHVEIGFHGIGSQNRLTGGISGLEMRSSGPVESVRAIGSVDPVVVLSSKAPLIVAARCRHWSPSLLLSTSRRRSSSVDDHSNLQVLHADCVVAKPLFERGEGVAPECGPRVTVVHPSKNRRQGTRLLGELAPEMLR